MTRALGRRHIARLALGVSSAVGAAGGLLIRVIALTILFRRAARAQVGRRFGITAAGGCRVVAGPRLNVEESECCWVVLPMI